MLKPDFSITSCRNWTFAGYRKVTEHWLPCIRWKRRPTV